MESTLMPTRLRTIRDLPLRFKGVLLDQFGVLHDGKLPYNGAIASIEYLAVQRQMKILLLSNSSRRSEGALSKLESLGFQPEWFAGVVTSGEVTYELLRGRTTSGDEFWRTLGNKCLHLTWGARGAISLDGLDLRVVRDPGEADFVLAHGTEAIGSEDGLPTAASMEELREVLGECRACSLPMVVANPDFVTVDGTQLRPMPGSLARHYSSLGGEVHLMGKPAAVVYDKALRELDMPLEDVIAIGDSLEHDIKGAQGYGVETLLVAGGIHADVLGNDVAMETEIQGLVNLCKELKIELPSFVINYL